MHQAAGRPFGHLAPSDPAFFSVGILPPQSQSKTDRDVKVTPVAARGKHRRPDQSAEFESKDLGACTAAKLQGHQSH